MKLRALLAAFLAIWISIQAALSMQQASAFPVDAGQSLPPGSELNEDALDSPRELFHSEQIGGRKPYLVNLGNLAFNAPSILGKEARQANISCGSCHIQGSSNPNFFIPQMSSAPGTFDTSGPLFNPNADDHAFNPVRIPSLRGARYLAPYGQDGRAASLRDFVRNVIVVEFSGPEPSPAILDAVVAYIQDIDFLPNPSLAPGGKLTAGTSEAERRGEALFNKPFPHDPNLSCATCHVPSGLFIDHMQHDVGSGGFFRTPTLINADFNAPYFHDGRFNTFDQVVNYFDRQFDLRLLPQQKADLVAYLTAIGDGVRAYERDGAAMRLRDATDFASVLATEIPVHDNEIIALAVETVGGGLQDLAERILDPSDPIVSGGEAERELARRALKEVVLILDRIGRDATAGKYDEAAAGYKTYNRLMISAVPIIVNKAQPWSLFNPAVHDAHYAALRQQIEAGKRPGAANHEQ